MLPQLKIAIVFMEQSVTKHLMLDKPKTKSEHFCVNKLFHNVANVTRVIVHTCVQGYTVMCFQRVFVAWTGCTE